MPVLCEDDPEIRDMRGLHLFHSPMSNSSMRVRLLLEEKGAEWTSHRVSLAAGENLEPDFLRINPRGLVPALVHEGIIVTESNDILEHIDRYVPGRSFAPVEAARRSDVLDWVDRASELQIRAIRTYVCGKTGDRLFCEEGMALYREIQPDPALIAFHQKTVDGFTRAEVEQAERLNHALLGLMESALCSSSYLAGERYTLADIAWAPNVHTLASLDFPVHHYPHVEAWYQRIRQRPAWHLAVDRYIPRLPNWALRSAMKALQWLRT